MVNYHAHTFRCRHATGAERQYLERAIQNGVTHFGFSDHSPFVFPDGHESWYRVPMNLRYEYMESLGKLREELRGKIELFIGFEMEYLPAYFDDMLKTVNEVGGEYLILGQHFLGNEHPELIHAARGSDDETMLSAYTAQVIEGMETGVFSYVAHPDFFKFTGDEGVYEAYDRKLCRAAVRLGIPLEINLLGIRGKRIYPRESFWRVAAEEGAEVVIGFDTHDTKAAYDEKSLPVAMALIESYGLNYNPYPTLICPRTKKPLEMRYDLLNSTEKT
ncbi:MAG: histidinol-phosphatase [Clostridia bacterium]|nr:histidinol-phosphatase [Clostridia bacterium]